MSKDIKIRKGLILNLKGNADNVIKRSPHSTIFAINPNEFHGHVPKMLVKEGDSFKAGDPIFLSKYQSQIQFVSPVSGTLKTIERGAKRRILRLLIDAEDDINYLKTKIGDWSQRSSVDIKELLLSSGCWPFIKQRPYDIIANPSQQPKAIFISAYSTAPLAADVNTILDGQQESFQIGLTVLSKLAPQLHLSISSSDDSFLNQVENATLHRVSGPHPAGNVGVQIHHISPINEGETVWVVNPEDVAIIGRFFETGKFEASRTLAVVGSPVKNPCYYKTTIGSSLHNILKDAGLDDSSPVRIVNGDVLTGISSSIGGHLGFYNNTLSVLNEGNHYRMFGWLPFVDNSIHSMSRTSLSWLFPKRKYALSTNMNGEERAMVVTGEMERVFPMDIFPMQLIKECMAQNIEKMIDLGIYEVAPEDFALIDYTSTSKLEAQSIIREGLDLMIKEVG